MEAKEALVKSLHEADSELAALDRQADVIARKKVEMQSVRAGIIYTLARLGVHPDMSGNGEGSSDTPDWTAISRREAVIRVMERSSRPLSPHDIFEALNKHGRRERTSNGVSGVLTRMKKAGTALSVGSGKWVLAQPTQVGMSGLSRLGDIRPGNRLDVDAPERDSMGGMVQRL